MREKGERAGVVWNQPKTTAHPLPPRFLFLTSQWVIQDFLSDAIEERIFSDTFTVGSCPW